MQHHNFYINRYRELLTGNGVDVYTVKTGTFTINQTQLETTMELLNWEDGIGSWRLNRIEHIKLPIEESLLPLKENCLIEIHEHKTQYIDLTI